MNEEKAYQKYYRKNFTKFELQFGILGLGAVNKKLSERWKLERKEFMRRLKDSQSDSESDSELIKGNIDEEIKGNLSESLSEPLSEHLSEKPNDKKINSESEKDLFFVANHEALPLFSVYRPPFQINRVVRFGNFHFSAENPPFIITEVKRKVEKPQWALKIRKTKKSTYATCLNCKKMIQKCKWEIHPCKS